VKYDCADALALPYEDECFDLAWTQHVAMNIADRGRLYSEVHRVLRPGSRFAIYDVVAGLMGPVHFPVPWSRGSETSFLVTPDAMRSMLEHASFRVVDWQDRTDVGIAWFAERRKASVAEQASGATSPLGIHVAMGPDFAEMSANLGRNLTEQRVGLIQAVVERV
jgi:SAM-dependent methyltransferase